MRKSDKGISFAPKFPKKCREVDLFFTQRASCALFKINLRIIRPPFRQRLPNEMSIQINKLMPNTTILSLVIRNMKSERLIKTPN